MKKQVIKNTEAWENEYQNPQFLTLGTEPIADVKDFFRELRRKRKIDMADFVVLDLGCGNGKHVIYAVENFCKSGIGYDVSKTAIDMARKNSEGLDIHYEVRSIAEKFPLADGTVDLVLDVTSSNSLSEVERGKFLKEISRVLKPGGWMFVRALCVDGDANAKKLLQDFPGPETGTYILPDVGITERVFGLEEFKKIYSDAGFHLEHIEKNSGYQKWGNQSYKRNYSVAWYTKSA